MLKQVFYVLVVIGLTAAFVVLITTRDASAVRAADGFPLELEVTLTAQPPADSSSPQAGDRLAVTVSVSNWSMATMNHLYVTLYQKGITYPSQKLMKQRGPGWRTWDAGPLPASKGDSLTFFIKFKPSSHPDFPDWCFTAKAELELNKGPNPWTRSETICYEIP
jgi:hypothetical protein